MVVRNLSDLTEPEQARLWLKTELDSIRKGASGPTNKQPERFATYAASLLRDKVEKRQICSSKTEEKWMFALRHLFGLKDDEGTVDVGIQGLGDIFVDRLMRADIEEWRDSWEPRINAGTYSPTTVNDWIAVLRVITKKMKADYALPVDPCADVEDISTKGHRTYTFEQPNSLGVDEPSGAARRRPITPRDSTKKPAEVHLSTGRLYWLCFEREKGFEPSTSTLARWHSTTELLPQKLGRET
jgi:hypothetical protein